MLVFLVACTIAYVCITQDMHATPSALVTPAPVITNTTAQCMFTHNNPATICDAAYDDHWYSNVGIGHNWKSR